MTGIYSLLEGKALDGRYRIEALVGQGGMGAVYRARDLQLGRGVAVKVVSLVPETPEQAAHLRARFRREAHAAARLRHENVVTLYDFGTDEALGLDFIVMELLEGEDVQRRVRRAGPLPWKQASRILFEAARGLGAGHRAGLVHRDVKSANLFLEQDASGKTLRTRVLDFGIAQLGGEGATATQLTVAGHAPLSPAYASPEQQRGQRGLTPAADVWGLGVTAFEILTGTLPFTDEQRGAIALGGRVQPPSLARLNPSVPPAAEELVRRALSPDPAERPRDGDAFAREVAAIRRDQRAAAAPLPPPAEAPPAPVRMRLLAPPPSAPAPARSRGGGRMAGALAACVVALVSVAVWKAGPRGTDASAAQPFVSAPPAPSRAATEDEIQHIRSIFQRIEDGGQAYAEQRAELGTFTQQAWPAADSAYATLYRGAYGTEKARVRVFEDVSRRSLLFYYDATRSLAFVHEVSRSYEGGLGLEERFYFRDRALIRWRDMNNAIVPLGPDYDEKAAALLRISDVVIARGG